jgi:hypothetical protein
MLQQSYVRFDSAINGANYDFALSMFLLRTARKTYGSRHNLGEVFNVKI